MPKPVPGVPRWEAKSVVEVRVGMDGQVWLWDQGRAWPCVETQATQTPAPTTAKKEAAPASPRKPAANHPWRKHSPASSYSVAQHPASLQEDGGCLISYHP